VLAVTALGNRLTDARDSAYEALARIELTGAHFRTDIAGAAAERSG
jgi:phosphoribosylamine--glycine ligase